jgi:hypothetical protein
MLLVSPTAAVNELVLILPMLTVTTTRKTPAASPPISTTAPYKMVSKNNCDGWLTASLVEPIRIAHKLSYTCQEDYNGDKLLRRNGPSKFQKGHLILIVIEKQWMF